MQLSAMRMRAKNKVNFALSHAKNFIGKSTLQIYNNNNEKRCSKTGKHLRDVTEQSTTPPNAIAVNANVLHDNTPVIEHGHPNKPVNSNVPFGNCVDMSCHLSD